MMTMMKVIFLLIMYDGSYGDNVKDGTLGRNVWKQWWQRRRRYFWSQCMMVPPRHNSMSPTCLPPSASSSLSSSILITIIIPSSNQYSISSSHHHIIIVLTSPSWSHTALMMVMIDMIIVINLSPTMIHHDDMKIQPYGWKASGELYFKGRLRKQFCRDLTEW